MNRHKDENEYAAGDIKLEDVRPAGGVSRDMGEFSRRAVVILNVLIVVAVAVTIIAYIKVQKKGNEANAIAAFDASTVALEEMVSNYTTDIQRTCDGWANYINSSKMTMMEALDFIRQTKTSDLIAGHIIWADTLEGYSTGMSGKPEDIKPVDYSMFGPSMFSDLDNDGVVVRLTPKYTNQINEKEVMAFYKKVTLRDDDGSERDAIVLRVLQTMYLENQMTFPSGYENAVFALLDNFGEYVIQPMEMFGDNFYDFVAVSDPTISRETISEALTNDDVSGYTMICPEGKEIYFSFKVCNANPKWVLMAGLHKEDIVTTQNYWSILIVVFGLLAGLLIVDMVYFRNSQIRDKNAKEALSEQLNIIGRQETALKETLSAAEAANRAKSNFLSNMSHDIRTPMNTILGLSTLLTKDADKPDKVIEYTHKITSAGNHLLGLINDVLDMTKIERGQTSLNISEFSLPEMVEGFYSIIRPQTKPKNQSFEVYVEDVHYEHLEGDSLRINQVMINILSNSVKYTPPGGEITLTIREHQQTRRKYSRLEFIVKDNGIGMSQEFLKTIFDPFTREVSSTTNKIQGTGLGMAITKNLVDLMGGTIDVESQQGKGTTTTILLELAIPQEDANDHFWENNGLTNMLIVDDDPTICASIMKAMSGTGVSMQYANDGDSAIHMVESAHNSGNDFDLLLIDWQMPGMGGVETARRIRDTVDKEIPAMILTSYDWGDIEEESRGAGICGFLPKPFFLTNFRNTVEETIIGANRPSLPSGGTENSLAGRHFLIVEDNEMNAEILSDLLGMMDATANIAENGQVAVDKFLASQPDEYDAILMDVRMPVMGGYEATRIIRASEHPLAKVIPIIAMTANAFADDVRDALEAGMNAHVAKPIDMNQLEIAFRECINN